MKPIVVPSAFNDLCRHFDHDMEFLYPSFDFAVAAALGGMDEGKRGAIRDFLDEILDGSHSPEALAKMWTETPAQYGLAPASAVVEALETIHRFTRKDRAKQSEPQGLEGRRVLITGAGSGLGRAMSLALLSQGAKVALTSVDLPSLEETIRESGMAEDKALALAGDLAVEDDIHAISRQALEAFGGTDILINNAGLGPQSIRPHGPGEAISFREMSGATLERFFKVNAVAPHLLTVDLVAGMIERGWGRVINISTSLDTMLKQVGYGASKAANEAYAAMMAQELAETGVTVNALLPGGPVNTPFAAGVDLPPHRMWQPEVMVPPLLWLCSTASDGLTGRRYLAAKWDETLLPDEAAALAGSPIAWTGYGPQAMLPPEN